MLSQNTGYGELRARLFRIRWLFESLNSRSKLLEQIQLVADLKLDTAITKAKQSEAGGRTCHHMSLSKIQWLCIGLKKSTKDRL